MDSNRFFTEDQFNNELALNVNEDTLQRIWSDGVSSEDSLSIEFFYVSNSYDKLNKLAKYIKEAFLYTIVNIIEVEGCYEMEGETSPIEIGMSLTELNNWNIRMWEVGYEYDCRLDGWQVQIM